MRTRVLQHRVPLSMALLSAAVWSFSAIDVRTQGKRAFPSSELESTIDTRVLPGDDFFAYANGAWLNAAVIPPGKDRWAARDEINELTRRQVAAILDEAPTARAGSLARKVADFRSALMDQSAIEAKGISPIQPMLSRIDAVGDTLALTRLLGSTMHADVDPLNLGVYSSSSVLGLSVEHSIHGEKTYTAFVLQGGLGLGEREQYLNTDSRGVERRHHYRK